MTASSRSVVSTMIPGAALAQSNAGRRVAARKGLSAMARPLRASTAAAV